MTTDMSQFVTNDASDFITAKGVEEPRRCAHGGALRISYGGEGIGLRAVHQIDPRHRQAGALREFAHDRYY